MNPVTSGDVTSGNVYDDFGPYYADHVIGSTYNALYERPAALALAGDVRGLRVLDAGCGPGIHAAELLAGGAVLTGLDGSAGQLAVARERLGPDVPLHHADLSEPLPLPDSGFDLVFSSLVLHYIRDWGPTLREFHRVLAPGGLLVASTHHPFMRRAVDAGTSYFDTYQWSEEWRRGDGRITMRFWHRPLHAITDALTGNGFQIDVLGEPQPLPEAEQRSPDAFAALSTSPQFLFVKARAGSAEVA